MLLIKPGCVNPPIPAVNNAAVGPSAYLPSTPPDNDWLPTSPPLVAARHREHYVHDQRILIHKVSASIGTRSVAHIKSLADRIAPQCHHSCRLPIDVQRREGGDVGRVS